MQFDAIQAGYFCRYLVRFISFTAPYLYRPLVGRLRVLLLASCRDEYWGAVYFGGGEALAV